MHSRRNTDYSMPLANLSNKWEGAVRAIFAAGAGYAGPKTTEGPVVGARKTADTPLRVSAAMSVQFANTRRAAGLAARASWCLGLAAALAGAARSQEVIQFVSPSAEVVPSTLSVTGTGPAQPVAPPASATPQLATQPASTPLDLATLANFAQAAAEEIDAAEAEELDRPFRPISQVTIDASFPPGVLPGQPGTEPVGLIVSPRLMFSDPRFWGGWAEMDYQWACTALCHRPLYFEEVNLERYGYTVSPILQPAISGAHFFLTIPTLPYKVVAQPPRECVYTLGYYRPGSPAPRRWHHVNWDPTAATVEGLLVTGLVFAIP
jgi:hypothetical protein